MERKLRERKAEEEEKEKGDRGEEKVNGKGGEKRNIVEQARREIVMRNGEGDKGTGSSEVCFLDSLFLSMEYAVRKLKI